MDPRAKGEWACGDGGFVREVAEVCWERALGEVSKNVRFKALELGGAEFDSPIRPQMRLT